MSAAKKVPKNRTRAKSTSKAKKVAAQKKPALSSGSKLVKNKPTTSKRAARSVKKTPKSKLKSAKKLKPLNKKTLPKSGGTLSFPRSISLSIFNPILLPATPDQLAIGTARFAGIFFVIAGFFFASYHSVAEFFPNTYAMFTHTNHTANVLDTCATPSVANDDDSDCAGLYDTAAVTDESEVRDVIFKIENKLPLNGIVTISLSAFNATEIEVKLYQRSTGEYHSIGSAHYVGEQDWNIEWNTTDFSDDVYKIYAIIKNEHVSYSQHSEKYFEVSNTTIYSDTVKESELVTIDIDTHSIENTSNKTADQDVVSSVKEETVELPKPAAITPNVDIDLSSVSGAYLTGFAKFKIEVQDAEFIEVYMVPKYTNLSHFVGLAQKLSPSVWSHKFNTADLPNGDYRLFVRIKNKYGLFDSESVIVALQNDHNVTETHERIIEEHTTLTHPSSTTIFDPKPILESTISMNNATSSSAKSMKSVSDGAHTVSQDDDILFLLEASVLEELKKLLNQYVVAFRVKNGEEIERIMLEIRQLKEQTNITDLSEEEAEQFILEMDNRLSELIVRTESDVIKSEIITAERTNEDFLKDSDSDGIIDIDEMYIFGTDPLSADTDGDGFIDGAEVLSGFDPVDATPEALVVYESPKKSGIVRTDILSIEEIITISEPQLDRDGVRGQALFRGKALPDSFVTIYIFSTPVIVTVKTDEEGNWEYQFDKELEDGSHEIYIGVTDNTGKIIAKSEPRLFIKEAQAFTPVDAEKDPAVVISQVAEDNSLSSKRMLLIIASISVVTIGLVLILLGTFLARREREFAVPQNVSALV